MTGVAASVDGILTWGGRPPSIIGEWLLDTPMRAATRR
jgi:hypothetical protein